MTWKALILIVALAATMAMAGQKAQSAKNQNKEQLSSSDKSFLKALIQEDMSEISLAKMALQKAVDPQVKQYAQTKILDADPEMQHGAESIAQDGGMKPPTGPNARQKKIHAELGAKSGKIFDNAYMVYEANQQPADFTLVQTEIKSTHNARVKEYVTKEEKPVKEAAASAKSIEKNLATSLEHYKQPNK